MSEVSELMHSLPELTTARLFLRCVSPTDAERLSSLMTPGISRWLASWSYPLPATEVTERIKTCLALAEANEALPYVIVIPSAELVIGWISIQCSRNSSHRGEISYWIGEEHQGKGYAVEACLIMLPLATSRMSLRIIEAGAQVENESSFAVMKRCGMNPASERLVYARTRARDELCRFYEWVPALHEQAAIQSLTSD